MGPFKMSFQEYSYYTFFESACKFVYQKKQVISEIFEDKKASVFQ